MRLIIAGSRTVHPTPAQIDAVFDDLLFVKDDVTEVVSGKCPRGADLAGEAWAKLNGIPIAPFPADWDKHGKAAGKLRNREMAIVADMAIVFWDGMSSGSCDMVTRMVVRDKPVRVVPMKAGSR
jgi:hypothetical protein